MPTYSSDKPFDPHSFQGYGRGKACSASTRPTLTGDL